MILLMAAITGCWLDQTYPSPAIIEMRITPGGGVLGRTDDQIQSFFWVTRRIYWANLRRLAWVPTWLDVEE